MKNWPRKEHFRFFSGMDYPHFNISANLDITHLKPFLKEQDLPFFTSLLYLSARAANSIKEFRYRIREGKVVEHETVAPAITVIGDNEVFGYCTIEYHSDPKKFMARAAEVIAREKENPTIDEDSSRDDVIYYTTIPWISFTSLVHPINLHPVDSIPRISWGKYFESNDRLLLPHSVQVHHGLADGFHAGKYFTLLQELLDQPEIL
ncbi:MAG: chloramphenicol acetyltransferase [Candidatus Auribacterota bacterium]|nr:chloramphenicol acetyltransferase [Candidatus Auribacterota bacterium]